MQFSLEKSKNSIYISCKLLLFLAILSDKSLSIRAATFLFLPV